MLTESNQIYYFRVQSVRKRNKKKVNHAITLIVLYCEKRVSKYYVHVSLKDLSRKKEGLETSKDPTRLNQLWKSVVNPRPLIGRLPLTHSVE